MRGNSLQGYTKRSGRSPGHSPGFQLAGQLSVRQYLVITNMMARYYLTGSCMGTTYPRASPPVTTASLSTALQAGRHLPLL